VNLPYIKFVPHSIGDPVFMGAPISGPL